MQIAIPRTGMSAGQAVGLRAAALIIDSIIVNGATFLLLQLNDSIIVTLIALLIWIPYYAVLEGTRGQTIGKMLLGLQVVKADGSAMDIGTGFIRTLLRFVDWFPYAIPYLLGAILIWTSSEQTRLGDRVAKTLVVRKGTVLATGTPSQRF